MMQMREVPRPEHPRPSFQRPGWVNLNGEWEFGAGESETFGRRIALPFCPQSSLSGIGERVPGDVGLLTFDRQPKVNRYFLREITQTPKKR
jgi:hypothetical protein